MELFHENTICLDLKAETKEEAIGEIVALLDVDGILSDRAAYERAILAREAQSTTGIGFGIAIPHAKSPAVRSARVALAISPKGVDYKSEDGSPVNLLFMIAVPDAADNLHLKMLARLSRRLIDPVFRNQLLACTTKESVMAFLKEV